MTYIILKEKVEQVFLQCPKIAGKVRAAPILFDTRLFELLEFLYSEGCF
jgi:hypothetical protein